MALTINTNLSSMIVQSNLAKSTNQLNGAIEKMTTGYKINHAKDNAAGYSIARNWETKISSLDIAAENAATGSDMLATLEDNYALVSQHVQRIRDLTEQAANGTYGTQSKAAIESEITARLEEIDRIARNCEYNGIQMMDGTSATDKYIQVGTEGGTEAANAKSQIKLAGTLFGNSKVVGLFAISGKTSGNYTLVGTDDAKKLENIAKDCAGTSTYSDHKTSTDMLGVLDNVIDNISAKVTSLGAAQNRIESAIESIGVQSENLTSSLSTLRDADVATESSKYIKAQILQQASATLLATANQTPSIALNLL